MRKKYGMRKSRTYKGKPHNSHVKPFKIKYKDDRGRVKKCKCFICGKEGHFAKDCRSKQGNIARSPIYQELDLDDNWDIVSADFDDSSVYRISERRDQAKEYYENKTTIQKKEELWQSKESSLIRDLTDALKIIEQLKAEQIKLEEQKDEEIRGLKVQLQKEKEKQTQVQEEFLPLRNSQTARLCIETKVYYYGNTTTSTKVRKITNQLYNVKVEFDIPNCPMFETTAIIDTRASTCCINKKVIPEEALEPLT
ncbi:Orf y [Tanacetum coccineum]